MRTGLYPGTFDPVTNGHLDIIVRASKLVDRLIVAVARNAGKGPLLSSGERLELVRAEVADLGPELNGATIEVRAFDNLLMHFARSVEASVVIRGLRAVSDFEYEFQMAGMNAKIEPEIDTVFLMASDRYQFISSRFVKEVGALGGNISPFVSNRVNERLRQIFTVSDAVPVNAAE